MMNGSVSYPGSGLPKLRVRCGKQYYVPFNIELGQRNARLIKRPMTPLRRLFRWADAFSLVPEPGYDLVHSKNAVPLLTKRPYIITFESYLPRVPRDRYIPWLESWLRQRLLSEQCVALVPQSEYALRQFVWQNRNYANLDALKAKVQVIYPAVALRRTTPKKPSGKLKLLFVGKDFMRKGGPALLRAHERLSQQGLPVESVVVSSLRWRPHDYIGPSSEMYVQRETRRLAQDNVVHYSGLRNADVLRLMEAADFFVFPTFHDTFGFAPLEALSCGTPVITTNTCAQPEIVDDGRCGYLLPFESDSNVGKWTWMSRRQDPEYLEAYDQMTQALSEAIVERVWTYWEAQSNYEAMSMAALEKVRSRFDKHVARDKLEELYELCRR